MSIDRLTTILWPGTSLTTNISITTHTSFTTHTCQHIDDIEVFRALVWMLHKSRSVRSCDLIVVVQPVKLYMYKRSLMIIKIIRF